VTGLESKANGVFAEVLPLAPELPTTPPPLPPFDESHTFSFGVLEDLTEDQVENLVKFEENIFYLECCSQLKHFYYAYWADALTMPDVKLIVKAYFARYGECLGLERLNEVLQQKYGDALHITATTRDSPRPRSETMPAILPTRRRSSFLKRLVRRFSSCSSSSSKGDWMDDVCDMVEQTSRPSSRRFSDVKPPTRQRSEKLHCSKSTYSSNRRLSKTILRFSLDDVKQIDSAKYQNYAP